MYNTGKGSGPIPAVLGASTAAVLPQTGMNTAVQIALAVAAGLVVWAAVYFGMSKITKR